MIELYYIEDDPDIARTVKEYLERKDFRVTVCTTVAQARQALHTRVPALILLDQNMPDGRGDSLCRWIRSNWKELPIIFLTVRGDCEDIVSGFHDGADDYVVKPFELEVLYSRIMALLRRTGLRKETRLFCNDIVVDTEKLSVYCGTEEILLSQPEYRLLVLLLENKGRTVTRKQLLEQVWDSEGNYVNDNTLTVAMKRLREKLHHPSCLRTIRSFGYRMEDSV